jgi:hypothetical protein
MVKMLVRYPPRQGHGAPTKPSALQGPQKKSTGKNENERALLVRIQATIHPTLNSQKKKKKKTTAKSGELKMQEK